MSKLYYTGIGSREVPHAIELKMREIGKFLAKKEYILRSGAAEGSDSAFERGCDEAKGEKEIWLPWLGFNDHKSTLLWDKVAWNIASTVHPIWDDLDVNAKCLHARNIHQCSGIDCKTFSKFLICYTEGGKVKGGSATAINYSKENKIPVFNLGFKNGLDKFREYAQTL